MHPELVFLSSETMRLLTNLTRNEQVLLVATGKDQQPVHRMGFVWSHPLLADNQVSISRTSLDSFSDQQLIEVRRIPLDSIHDAENLTLRFDGYLLQVSILPNF